MIRSVPTSPPALIGTALLAVLTACAAPTDGGGLRLESTLTTSQATRLIRSPTANAAGNAYAIRQLRRQAESGDMRALSFLARSYLRGANGVDQDDTRAVFYFEQLLASGDATARSILLRTYLDPDSSAHDIERALALLEQQANAGDLEAALKLSELLLEQGQPARAVAALDALSQAGTVEAQMAQADILIDPETRPFDPIRAIRTYETIAALQNTDALYALGRAYLRGTGVDEDRTRAVTYFERGMLLGDPRGTLQYGLALITGRGAPRDEQRGIALLERAAMAGNAGGWLQLGRRAPARYVTLMQGTLREQGAYSGGISGDADAATLASLDAWCVQRQVDAACASDVFGREVAIALARSLR